MRWIFLALLLINGGYALWHVLGPRLPVPVDEPVLDVRPASTGIELIGESSSLERRQAVSDDLCLFLGGGIVNSRVAAIRQRLLALDIPADLMQEERVGPSDFWVYLPDPGSLMERSRLVDQLQAQGEPAHVILSGLLQGAVSLGVESSAEAAELRLKALRGLGHVAALHELPSVQKRYWVRIRPEVRHLVSAEVLQRLSVIVQELKRQEKSCKWLDSVSGSPYYAPRFKAT